MALEIDAKIAAGKGPAAALGLVQEGDIMTGINKFMTSLNQAIGGGSKLLDSYSNIKDKLGTITKGPQQTQNTGGIRQIPTQQYIEPATQPAAISKKINPSKINDSTPVVKSGLVVNTEDKAEEIFNKAHEMAKPYLMRAKAISAGKVIEMALKPENKKKIIEIFSTWL